MMGCKKCQTMGGLFFLIAGILFLLRDLAVWGFWGIQWWTILFLLWGIGSLGMASCPECQAVIRGRK